MATVELIEVKKNYGNVPAVRGVSLKAADGEFIVLVGPSGCGKSTLLRMVAGLETVTEGTVLIGGDKVNDKEPADRDIAMVFQNYALYPHMTVRGNLEYGLKNRGVRREEIARRVGEAADLLEIAPMLDRKPRQLSGGQRQRVAMGRALVRDPKVFLFDEPLSNLDAKLRVQMRVEIRRLQRRLGTTSLYVTHDQLEAMTLADRLVVMNAGLVEQIGTPEEVYERPATLFVAGFIGSPPMNLLPRESLEAAVAGLPAGLPPGTGIVGIRPDQMALAAPADESLAIPATVELVEPAGGESYVYARLSGTGEAIVVRVQGKPHLPQDGAINLFVRVADLHPFDRETGRRAD